MSRQVLLDKNHSRALLMIVVESHTERATFCFYLYPNEYLSESESKKNKFVIAFNKLT